MVHILNRQVTTKTTFRLNTSKILTTSKWELRYQICLYSELEMTYMEFKVNVYKIIQE